METITIKPKGPIFGDTRFTLAVEGLTPNTDYTLIVHLEDDHQQAWANQYPFKSLSKTHYSFEEYFPRGSVELIERLLPENGANAQHFMKKSSDPTVIRLSLKKGGYISAETSFKQQYLSGDIEKTDFSVGLCRGYLYKPKKIKEEKIVLILGGSGGGINETRAALLASKGFLVLALAYFRFADLPETLESIPLEYFLEAIHWLKEKYPGFSITLMGYSKGGELSLLLGSLFSSFIESIVAIVPSSVTYGGFPEIHKPAWMYQKKAYDPAPFPDVSKLLDDSISHQELRATPLFLSALKEQREAYVKAQIPIENFDGPLLLISAGDDQMWPSELFCHDILERLNQKKPMHQATHICYEKAGHLLNPPFFPNTIFRSFHPVNQLSLYFGGETFSNARACEESWNQILDFLKQ